MEGYGGRDQTRSDHLREVAAFLGWRPAGEVEFKELDQFLLARAMEHDAPTVLFRLACEHLRSCRVIRPGPEWLTRRVAAARTAANAETFQRVEPLLTTERCRQLDELLTVDAELGFTRLYWLGTGATQASPKAINTELAKLAFLRELGTNQLDLSRLPVERRRFLATIGRRSTAQALARRDPQRRYPILLALLAQTAVDVLDEVIQLFDQAVSATESRARAKLDERLAERARAGEGRQALLDEILQIATDPAVAVEQVGALLQEQVGLERMREAQAAAWPDCPVITGI